MKREMTHDEAFTALDAAAIDALDPAERDAVLAHAERCDICRHELAQLRDTAALLAFSSPLAADTASGSRGRIQSRLMARAAADAADAADAGDAGDRAERAESVQRGVSALAWRRAEWMAVAASVLLVASVSILASVLRDRATLREALKDQIAQSQRAATARDSLRLAVMSRDSMIAGLTGKDVAMMTLTSSGARAPFAHMFWDRAHNTWTLVAHNLPDLKPGRTYQLWLVTPNAKISAGTFAAHDGDAMMRATYALSPSQLMALAVTEEPAGGMPQPTSAPIMAVSAH